MAGTKSQAPYGVLEGPLRRPGLLGNRLGMSHESQGLTSALTSSALQPRIAVRDTPTSTRFRLNRNPVNRQHSAMFTPANTIPKNIPSCMAFATGRGHADDGSNSEHRWSPEFGRTSCPADPGVLDSIPSSLGRPGSWISSQLCSVTLRRETWKPMVVRAGGGKSASDRRLDRGASRLAQALRPMPTTQELRCTMQFNACSPSATSRNGYKFTGKERDSESGLDNFRQTLLRIKPGPVHDARSPRRTSSALRSRTARPVPASRW